MRILYGTTNAAKLQAMQRELAKLNIEVIGLKDLGLPIPVVEETGRTLLENAELKAKAYYAAFRMPVFSVDTGMYFENLPDNLQPGIHVRTIRGRVFTDEEMTAYYGELAKQYAPLTAYYKNGICLCMDGERVYSRSDESMESDRFLICPPSRPVRRKGFPIDAMSIDLKTGKHFYDLEESITDKVAVQEGILQFFNDLKELKGE